MENLYIGLLGSLLILDTTVAFQFLISQPLIACTLLGWFLGDAQLGLQIGVYLQLLWLSSIPVGAAIVPEGNVAAIIVTGLVVRHHQIYDYFNTLLICGLLLGILVSYLGGELVVISRKSNRLFLEKMMNYTRKGSLGALTVINFLALVFHFLLMFILIYLAMLIGDFLFKYITRMPAEWDHYFKYAVTALIAIGSGLVLSMFREKKFHLSLATGLIAGGLFFLL
jgi:mannose/fructose/N-acetylgalactosamine-specific phosphotransferase system component IIC